MRAQERLNTPPKEGFAYAGAEIAERRTHGLIRTYGKHGGRMLAGMLRRAPGATIGGTVGFFFGGAVGAVAGAYAGGFISDRIIRSLNSKRTGIPLPSILREVHMRAASLAQIPLLLPKAAKGDRVALITLSLITLAMAVRYTIGVGPRASTFIEHIPEWLKHTGEESLHAPTQHELDIGMTPPSKPPEQVSPLPGFVPPPADAHAPPEGFDQHEVKPEDLVFTSRGGPWTDDPLAYYQKHYGGLTRGQLPRANPALYQLLAKKGLLDKVPLSVKNLWVDDPIAYYHEHYDGLTRTQLFKENPALYALIKKRGLLDTVPTATGPWTDDPLAYYHKHYEGLTRGQLQKENGALYRLLANRGLLDKVPNVVWGPWVKDPLAYYRQHYDGLTRTQVFKENPALYSILRHRNLLDRIPLAPEVDPENLGGGPAGPWADDPIAYYHEHFEGMTRGQLGEASSSFYQYLTRKGLLENIPVVPANPWVENPLAYYYEHYGDLTRGQLIHENPLLYKLLLSRGFIEKVPTTFGPWVDDPLAYYHEHYDGLTRGQLIDKNPALYRFLQSHGLLEKIPTVPENLWTEDPLGYYHKNYEGLTRGQLSEKNNTLYKLLQRRGLLDKIPLKAK